MAIAKRQVDGAYILELSGDLQTRYAQGIFRGYDPECGINWLEAAISEVPDGSIILLDFSGFESKTSKVDRDFAVSLFQRHRDVEKKGSILGIWGAKSKLLELITSTHLDKLLNVMPGRKFPDHEKLPREEFPTLETAIAKLQKLFQPELGMPGSALTSANMAAELRHG